MHFTLKNIRPLTQILKNKISIKNELTSFTFFVTSICNLRCKYCLNFENLGSGKFDLSFDEIEKFSKFIPSSVKSIIFSGGEPLWRDDIVDICKLFYEKNNIVNLGFPTNAVHNTNTINKIKEIVKISPEIDVVACVALDVFEETHNKFRGKGTFQKTYQTLKDLVNLKKSGLNFEILVNSVIGKDSIPRLEEFVKFVKNIDVDLHSIEIVRDETIWRKEGKYSNLSKEDFNIVQKSRLLIDKLYRSKDLLLSVYKMRSKVITKIQENVLTNNGKWPSSCSAGLQNFVLQSNGDITICENKNVIGNLRNYNYNAVEILKQNGQEQIKEAQSHKCDCSNYMYLRQSIENSFIKSSINHILS